MINLTTITSKIRLQTSSTAGIDVSTSYMDYNGTIVTPGGLVTKITTATTTDIVGVPGASTTRNVKGIFVTNIHASTSNTVTITHFDGTNSVEIWGGTLLAGESLEYVDTQGFIKYSANGVANGGADGTNGTNGTNGTGTVTFSQIEVSVSTVRRRHGVFTIAGVGMTIGKPVLIQQARAAYTGKGTLEDESDMDTLTVIGTVVSAILIRCSWQSRTFVRGNFKFNYVIGA